MEHKRSDRIAELIKDVESIAKRLRADVRKRAKALGLTKNLQSLADQLRKRAATVAGQVEKYAHEIRKDLEGKPVPAKRRRTPARKAKPKAAVPRLAL